MRLDEITGDADFDKMIGNISSSDTPSVDLSNRKTVPDRKIMELTHKIFLRLREYDDPEIYEKFINFMIKTVETNVGPIDESKSR
jgi:hypothetical protein